MSNLVLNTYVKNHINEINWKNFTVEKYDSESQTFKISFSDYNDIAIIKVPLAEAISFKDNQSKLKIINQNYIIQNDVWAGCCYPLPQ